MASARERRTWPKYSRVKPDCRPSGAVLFIVDVEEIEFSGAIREGRRQATNQPAHHGFAKGIEKEHQARAAWNARGDGVRANELRRRLDAGRMRADGEIAASDIDEDGIQLHADDLSERMFRGEQHGATHARADVNESELIERSAGSGSLQRLSSA